MKILIVDSREIVRLGLKKILIEVWPRVEIWEASDLNSAIEKIAYINYDLLLINTDVGGKGELMGLIKFLLNEARIVMLTDTEDTNQEELLQFIDAGVATVIPMKGTDLMSIKNVFTHLF